MKHALCAALLAACLSGSAAVFAAPDGEGERPDNEMRLDLGMNIRFIWWRPPWGKFAPGTGYLPVTLHPEIRPTALFGPVGTLMMGQSWSLSLRFLFGEHPVVVNKPILMFKNRSETTSQIFDLDVSAARALNWYVKFFFGGRYFGYLAEIRYIAKHRFAAHSGGPVAGFGFRVPIAGTLCFLTDVSGIALGGRSGNGRSFAAGGELSASFAYMVESIRSTVSLGGTYRYLRCFRAGDRSFRRNDDHRGGVDFMLRYHF